jgi:hypothetical protein
MDTPDEWDKWLTEVDSVEALAPEGHGDHAADARARVLGQQLINVLAAAYEVRRGSTELHQDSTGFVGLFEARLTC